MFKTLMLSSALMLSAAPAALAAGGPALPVAAKAMFGLVLPGSEGLQPIPVRTFCNENDDDGCEEDENEESDDEDEDEESDDEDEDEESEEDGSDDDSDDSEGDDDDGDDA